MTFVAVQPDIGMWYDVKTPEECKNWMTVQQGFQFRGPGLF